MVLPCGHTYVCLVCTQRLKRCMECRRSLFLPIPKSANATTTRGGESSTTNNDGTIGGWSTRRQRGGYQSRLGAPTSASRQPLSPPAPPPQVPLPIPKNLVLLSMIQAAEQQRKTMERSKERKLKKWDENDELSSSHVVPDEVDLGRGGNGHQEDDNDEEEVWSGESDEDDDSHSSNRESDLNRVIRSVETMASSCGTYAVRDNDGLVVLPKDPHMDKRRRLIDTSAVLKESSSTNCSSVASHHSSSVASSSRGGIDVGCGGGRSRRRHRFMADTTQSVGGGSTNNSSGKETPSSVRQGKRRIENIFKGRRPSNPLHIGAEKDDDDDDNNSKDCLAPTGRDESELWSEYEAPPPLSQVQVSSLSAANGTEVETAICGVTTLTHMDDGLTNPNDDHHGDVVEGTTGRGQGRFSRRSPSTIASSSADKVSPSSKNNAGTSSSTKEPFRIQYGQKVQVISFQDGVATLARNQGFILATHSQLVKVGPATDISCRLEGLLETISNKSQDLESKLKANTNLCKVLFKRIQKAQREPAKHPIVTEPPQPPSPQVARRTMQDDQQEKRYANGQRIRTVRRIGDDSDEDDEPTNLNLSSSTVEATETTPPTSPETPPAEHLHRSLLTPDTPNRNRSTTTVEMGLRSIQASLAASPKTIDNADLGTSPRNSRYSDSHSNDNLSLVDGRQETMRRGTTTSVVENEQVDITFGCGTSLLSAECISQSTEPIVNDLFLPTPRIQGSSGNDSQMQNSTIDGQQQQQHDTARTTVASSTTTRQTRSQDSGHDHPSYESPLTPGAPAIAPATTTTAGSAGVARAAAAPMSSSGSSLTPVLQPIYSSSFDSAVNFRTGMSGHCGLTSVGASKKYNKNGYNSPQSGQHNNYHRRIRMMGEHRGLGSFRLQVKQTMSSWGISTPVQRSSGES